RHEPRENLLGGGMVPVGRSGTDVEPGRVARQPGLAEGDEPGSPLRRLRHQVDRLRGRALEVEEDRRRLHRRDPNDGGAVATRTLRFPRGPRRPSRDAPDRSAGRRLPAGRHQRIEAMSASKFELSASSVLFGPVQRKNQFASRPGTIAPSIIQPGFGGGGFPGAIGVGVYVPDDSIFVMTLPATLISATLEGAGPPSAAVNWERQRSMFPFASPPWPAPK